MILFCVVWAVVGLVLAAVRVFILPPHVPIRDWAAVIDLLLVAVVAALIWPVLAFLWFYDREDM